MSRTLLTLVMALFFGPVAAGCDTAVAQEPAGDAAPAAEAPAAEAPAEQAAQAEATDRQAEYEAKFTEMLTGATLVGSFTTVDSDDDTLREDRYMIDSVKKLNNEYWRFDARIQYGDRDVKIPLPLKVKWAGDTPVVTLTNVVVPGLGTYTARVVFYNDKYAGTWSAGDHGGHMFGRIERNGDGEQEAVEGGTTTADEQPSAAE